MRPEVEQELIESLKRVGPAPCVAFKCEHYDLCKDQELACSAFRKYASRRTELVPRPTDERPTKAIWLEIFKPKQAVPTNHENAAAPRAAINRETENG